MYCLPTRDRVLQCRGWRKTFLTENTVNDIFMVYHQELRHLKQRCRLIAALPSLNFPRISYHWPALTRIVCFLLQDFHAVCDTGPASNCSHNTSSASWFKTTLVSLTDLLQNKNNSFVRWFTRCVYAYVHCTWARSARQDDADEKTSLTFFYLRNRCWPNDFFTTESSPAFFVHVFFLREINFFGHTSLLLVWLPLILITTQSFRLENDRSIRDDGHKLLHWWHLTKIPTRYSFIRCFPNSF